MAGTRGSLKNVVLAAVSVLAIFVVIAVSGVLAFRAVPDPPSIDCDDVRSSDERASRAALIPVLRSQLVAEVEVYERALAALSAIAGDEQQELGDVTKRLDAELGTPELEGDENRGDRIAQLKQREGELEVEIAALKTGARRSMWAAVDQVDATIDQLSALYAQAGDSPSERVVVDEGVDEIETLDFLLDEDLADVEYEEPLNPTAVPPLTLQPTTPSFVIPFGSYRTPRRIEIVLEAPSAPIADTGATTAADESIANEARLPNQASYESIAGQFREEVGGREIPPENIQVWARRVGPSVLLNVCIDPDDNLAAGSYIGEVHLVDPTITSVRVPVTVTAQFKWIDLLYLALPVFPFLAMLYVWYTAGAVAAGNPWDIEKFKEWAGPRFLVLFGVGVAAVWATLQVAFNNPIWGRSLFGSAGLVVGGLAAAATAMTAVAAVRPSAGKGRDPDPDSDSGPEPEPDPDPDPDPEPEPEPDLDPELI